MPIDLPSQILGEGVPEAGFEPARCFQHGPAKFVRLPVPPFGHVHENGIQYIAAPEPRRRRRRFGALAWVARSMGVVCAIVGVFGIWEVVTGTAPMRWSSVPTVIESSEIRPDTVNWNGGRRGRGPSPITASRFYVTYSYSIDRRVHTGNRVDVFAPTGKNYPRRYQLQYPVGKTVEVHVDPSDVTQAVLETPWPLGSLIQAIGGLSIAVLLLRWSFEELRPNHDGDR